MDSMWIIRLAELVECSNAPERTWESDNLWNLYLKVRYFILEKILNRETGPGVLFSCVDEMTTRYPHESEEWRIWAMIDNQLDIMFHDADISQTLQFLKVFWLSWIQLHILLILSEKINVTFYQYLWIKWIREELNWLSKKGFIRNENGVWILEDTWDSFLRRLTNIVPKQRIQEFLIRLAYHKITKEH